MLDNITNNYHCCHPKPELRLVPLFGPFTESVGPVQKTPGFHKFPLIGGSLMAAVKMNTVQQFLVTIQPVDKKGNPAQVEGLEWMTSNSDAVALEPSEDGLSCLVKAVGIPANATVQVNADADLGDGVQLLTGTIDIEIVAAPAVNIVLTPGPVEDIPDAPPEPVNP